jgi:hypothetical protein
MSSFGLTFGLSRRALVRLRATKRFPPKDPLVHKTDRRAVELFFDYRAGINSTIVGSGVVDGKEDFGG